MKKGLLIIAILLGLIIFKDIPGVLYILVDADTIVPNYGIDINSSNFDGYKYLGNSKNGNPQNARIEIYQDSLNALDYNFIIIDVCSTNDIRVFRTASIGNSCTNSCISNAIGITKTSLNCKSNGYDGYIYRVNGSISKWYIGTGSSTIYSVNDQISLVNDKSNNVPISIYGVYISDSETIQNITIDYTQNFNNIINNQNQNTQNIMDQNHNYNNDSSENLQGQQDLDNMTQAEDNLMNNLDFSGVNNVNITINPNASNFIWQIVENLRNMNASIVLLFTSILGLGIIKLVLNR